ncbi:Hsp20 heat shock protein [Synechococcus phage S-SM1]|jgi:molecular chaperone IbpA|uniref:Heat shock protein n=1 Tax=Synechococcus phage S-SM1 TaxID=444859 RepID=E3SIH8_9CAUD|nr:Hsp20 heat shock protein [Synechococcus phage S-SM1]ADO97179.1 heat shock protein [Synechococcus phage S-SM1]
MTGLRKFGTKDLGAIVDAAERYSVGLDDIFYRLHSYGMGTANEAYPPYNLVKESEVKWRIEMALAGWDKDEIEVSTESNVLLVRSKEAKSKGEEEYMHRGVATRTFARGFNLSDDVEIGEVKFINGMLTINLQKIIPEHQQLKVYDID